VKSNNQTLGTILYSQSQYVVPVFQRYYRWHEPQWAKLWDNLVGLLQPEKTGRHFMGFLVLVPEIAQPGKITTFHVIDGQQRLTTLSLLLIALRNAARKGGVELLAHEIDERYLIDKFKKGSERFRLFPKVQDQAHYIAAVTGEAPAGGRIGAALEFFSAKLAELGSTDTEATLRSLLHLLTARLEFIYALLEGDDPYNIYKSLNSTGVPLGPADLIRNFIFMHIPPGEQDELDRNRWRPLEARFSDAEGNLDGKALSSLFRDFLMRNGTYVRPKETFDEFEDRYAETELDPLQLAGELGVYSELYAVLRGTVKDASPAIESALEYLRALDSSTTYPLLLSPSPPGIDLQREYWTAFVDFVQSSETRLKPLKARSTSWLNFGFGGKGRNLVAYANMQKHRVAVGLYLSAPNAAEALEQLRKQAEEIEVELGAVPTWREDPRRAFREVSLSRALDPADRNCWPECFEWTKKTLEAFDRAFRKRLGISAESHTVQALYMDYFTAFCKHLVDNGSFLKPQSPQPSELAEHRDRPAELRASCHRLDLELRDKIVRLRGGPGGALHRRRGRQGLLQATRGPASGAGSRAPWVGELAQPLQHEGVLDPAPAPGRRLGPCRLAGAACLAAEPSGDPASGVRTQSPQPASRGSQYLRPSAVESLRTQPMRSGHTGGRKVCAGHAAGDARRKVFG
jgi:hypothetical protein